MYNLYELNKVKKSCLVLDIETSAFYSDGTEVNIRTNFDDYLERAEVKWFGAYSYQNDQMYLLNAYEDSVLIRKLLATHKTIVGFNSGDFDFPILKNNNLTDEYQRYLQVDCMQILGTSSFRNKNGFAFKNRGALMKYKFKKNSLKCIAETMKLETQKGDIDYKIFHKNEWTEDETKEIKKYLASDVMATKQMFDKLWDFWIPFAEMLDEKSAYDLSWIRSSIASLTYKAACNAIGVEPTYGEIRSAKEEMGGRVITPKVEEARNGWYVDFSSLYPHVFAMFNLFAETNNENAWHGNKVFKVKGYYDITKKHLLCEYIEKKLKERIDLKKNDAKNRMIEAIKNFLTGLYGVVRSAIFEQLHTENAGWDCCWIGQQIHELTEEMMDSFGFDTIYGDTDSLFIVARDESDNNRDYVKECLEQIVDIINDNVPFPIETFGIDIEDYIKYIMFPFSEQPIIDEETGKNKKIKNRLVKERKGKKKNYCYINEDDKIKLMGLPIKKENATKLGIKIYEEVLKEEILKNQSAKFSYEKINNIINDYLKQDDIMQLISQEYKVKSFSEYKNEGQIQAQISKQYFNEDEGVINLVKNKKIGKVGKGNKYCTVQEAIDAKLTAKELDLEKLWNELDPFIDFETIPKKEKKVKKSVKKTVKKSKVIKMVKEELKNISEIKSEKIDKTTSDVLNLKKEEKKTQIDDVINWD